MSMRTPFARSMRRRAARDKRQLATWASALDSHDLAVYWRGMTTLGPRARPGARHGACPGRCARPRGQGLRAAHPGGLGARPLARGARTGQTVAEALLLRCPVDRR